MNYRVTHLTTYTYSDPVSFCHNEVRLIPRSHPAQQLLSHRFEITPPPSALRTRQDPYGNPVTYFAIQQPHKALSIRSASHLRVSPPPEIAEAADSPPWERVRERLSSRPDHWQEREFRFDSPLIQPWPELAEYARDSFPEGRPLREAAWNLTNRIFSDFRFKSGHTTVSTPLTQVFTERQGVCQDFAHLAIACLRGMGLAARYVSGYIETLPPPGTEKLVGVDASHAWFSVWEPGGGWHDFDPTNNVRPADQHITLAWGRDFSDITPVKGVVFSRGNHTLSVAVDVTRMA